MRLLAGVPQAVVRLQLERFDAQPENYVHAPTSEVEGVLANYDVAGLDVVIALTERSAQYARALLPVNSAEVAFLMADWMARSKTVRPVGASGLRATPRSRCSRSSPPALTRPDNGAAERRPSAPVRGVAGPGGRRARLRVVRPGGRVTRDRDCLERLGLAAAGAELHTLPLSLAHTPLRRVLEAGADVHLRLLVTAEQL